MVTKDHKPSEDSEQKRITEAGGKIYQSSVQCGSGAKETIVGPKRVLPGRLSVSRTFGDPEAKLIALGGKPGVIVAEPEVKSFKITEKFDFVVLASDGIYDKLNNKDVVQCVSSAAGEMGHKSVHDVCGSAVECIVKNALMRKSLDNVTVVIFSFKHFKHFVKQKLAMTHTYSGIPKDLESVPKKALETPKAAGKSEFAVIPRRPGDRGKTPDSRNGVKKADKGLLDGSANRVRASLK